MKRRFAKLKIIVNSRMNWVKNMEDSAKIAIVGSCTVGKTSLVKHFCTGHPVKNTDPTIGCEIDVLMYEYKPTNGLPKNFFIQIYDVSGSDDFSSCYHLYLKDVDGIVLVHDLTNQKSTASLNKWLWLVSEHCSSPLLKLHSTGEESLLSTKLDCPLLVVGTKQDLNPNWVDKKHHIEQIQFQYNCQSIKLNTQSDSPSFMRPNTKSGQVFDNFFSAVIGHKLKAN